MTLKKEQGGINKFEENNEHLNKTIRILQNKLEQVIIKEKDDVFLYYFK